MGRADDEIFDYNSNSNDDVEVVEKVGRKKISDEKLVEKGWHRDTLFVLLI